jgi:hypothetical protein
VLHQSVCRDPGHHDVGTVDAPSAVKAKCKCQDVTNFVRGGWTERGNLGHARMVLGAGERRPNQVIGEQGGDPQRSFAGEDWRRLAPITVIEPLKTEI